VGGVVFYGFTAIFEPIAEEMGWSYAQISLAASLRGLELGILAPLTGMMTDRWGPRRILMGGAILTAGGLFLLSQTSSLATFYGAFALLALGMSATIVTVLLTAVANWFRARAGLASGIAICGFGFSGIIVPFIVRLVDVYDWRMAVVFLGAGVLVVALPLSLVFRHRPERYGYLPDGGQTSAVGAAGSPPPAPEMNVGVGYALRSPTFWRISLTYMCHMIFVSSIITHVMPYLSSVGVARAQASLVAMAIPIISVGGRLSFGWFADKFTRRRIAATAYVMMTLGLLCFGSLAIYGLWFLVPFLLLFGIGYGGSNALRPALVTEYFGRSKFGSIFGLMVGINALGGILGPPLAGWVFDTWGSYQGIWFVYAIVGIGAVLSVAGISRARV
jgi:MFS family permease